MRFALLAVLVLSAPAAALPVFVPRFDAEGFPLPREAVRRLGSAKFLCGYCNQLAWSADGKTVFVGGSSAWDVATGQCKWTANLSAEVHSVAVSADGKAIWATASKSSGDKYAGLLLKIDLTTGRKLLERKIADDYIRDSRVSTQGRVLLSSHTSIRVFDAAVEKPIYDTPRNGRAIRSSGLSADGQRLLLSEGLGENQENPHRITSVDIKSGKTVGEVRLATWGGTHFGSDANTLVLCVGNQFGHSTPDVGRRNRPTTISQWDLKTGKELRSGIVAPSGVGAGGVVAYSPDGRRAVLLVNRVPVLFDAATWKRVREFDAVREVDSAAFSPDGKVLAVGGKGLAFVEVATGKLVHGSAPLANGHDDFRFADGGRTLVRGYGVFGQLRYGVATGKRTVVRDDGPIDLPHGHFVARDRDGLRQAKNVIDMAGQTTDLRQGAIELHAVGQPNVVRELPSSGNMFYERLDFSQSGRYLLGAQREEVTVWDTAAEGKPRRISWEPPPGGSSSVGAQKVVACPLDRLVAIHETNSHEDAGAWSVGIYELATGKRLTRLSGTGLIFSPLAWSADGSRLAFGGSQSRDWEGKGFLSVYDAAAGRYVLEGVATEHVQSEIVLSPDGRTAAVPRRDGVELIEAATGNVRRKVVSSGSIAFHPDGRHFATESGLDGVLLWDSLSSPAAWPKEADALWASLGKDAAAAHAAIRTLVANPEKAVPLLKAKMAEVKPLPADRIAALVAQLGDKDFATRDSATKELLEHIDDAKPTLKKTVANAAANAEAKARAAKLLTQVPPNTPDRLRVLRAVEAAELIGTADAIILLRAWSVGTGFRATEATTALARLKK